MRHDLPMLYCCTIFKYSSSWNKSNQAISELTVSQQIVFFVVDIWKMS
jgi:hypothetical protein